MVSAFCGSCESEQDVEPVEDADQPHTVFCCSCGEEFVIGSEVKSGADVYENYVVGLVLSVEPTGKGKDLKKVLIRVGNDESDTVQVVTNAKYIDPNWLVVVAKEGAIVPAGSVLEDDPNAVQVKKSSVGGTKSDGMLCDSVMLGWTGGAKGAVQRLPEDGSILVGSKPPPARPSRT